MKKSKKSSKPKAHAHHAHHVRIVEVSDASAPESPAIPQVQEKKITPISISPESQREVAMEFAALIHKKFDSLIKATVLFGSQAKNTATSSSDIDIVVIVDDASVSWDDELIAWYRQELGKLLSSVAREKELHVNTIKLTTWWQDLLYGDPVVLNIIRYGEPLIDIAGFFKPIKSLLIQGKIHSTPEAVYAALQRAPSHLARSHASEMGAIEGVYWTMVDSAQAALITAGQLPPSPEHIPGLLKEAFVDKNYLRMELVNWYRELYNLHKGIVHGTIVSIKGAQIDIWQQRAQVFLRKMTELIDMLIESGKNQASS